MRHVFVVLLMLGVLVLPSCAAAAPKQAAVILAGNYWDGVSDGPLGAAEILVVDGRIADVGKSVARPEGARVIDLSSKFVTPGFIDSHVHLTGGSRFFATQPVMPWPIGTRIFLTSCGYAPRATATSRYRFLSLRRRRAPQVAFVISIAISIRNSSRF